MHESVILNRALFAMMKDLQILRATNAFGMTFKHFPKPYNNLYHAYELIMSDNINDKSSPQTTHFGYQEVPKIEKSNLVAQVFHSVAQKYDVMNDLMSLGLHRLWKQSLLAEANLHAGQIVLDVATGTGDLALGFAKRVGKTGRVIMTDINESMLERGRDRLIDQGYLNIDCIQADAEHLPFAENYFDCVTIAFGLRNVTDKTAALQNFYRVLKPGGKLLILEFSRPTSTVLQKIYDVYSFKIIPSLGEFITQNRDSYQYLVESIRMHPDQEALKNMLLAADFADVSYSNLSGGIVAIHKGYKY